MTQGAVMRSQRKAARKVSVRQRPCGTLATRRVPRAQRPCRRVMLVLAQVSSIKTRRLASSRPWYFFHRSRRRAMSGRSCSLACRLPEKHLRRGGCLLEDKAEVFGAAPKVRQDAGSVSFLVIQGARIRVVHAVTPRVVEQHGDLSGRSSDGFGLADPRR